MLCNNRQTYQIRQGDTLYSIAKNYNITVESIMAENNYLDPNRLHVGQIIYLCLDNNLKNHSDILLQLKEVMLEQSFIIFLEIIFIISDDQNLDNAREYLLNTANELANIYANFYQARIVDQLKKLEEKRLQIIINMIQAFRNNDIYARANLNKEYSDEVEKLATFLSSINHFYYFDELNSLYLKIFETIKEEIVLRYNQDYKNQVEKFNQLKNENELIANYLYNGIKKAFNI